MAMQHTIAYDTLEEAEKEAVSLWNKRAASRINTRIDVLYTEPDRTLKAIASVTVNGIAIHNIKIFDREEGLFVQMPMSYIKAYGNEAPIQICHAVDKELRLTLNNSVIEAYKAEIEKKASEILD